MKLKHLVPLPLILLAVTACQNRYASKTQALEACREWQLKGIIIFYKMDVKPLYSYQSPYTQDRTKYERTCKREDETDQILGYETDLVTPALKAKYNGQTVKEQYPDDLDIDYYDDYKVVRNFYY